MTQKEKILTHLKTGETLTPLEAAMQYNITELPGIVRKLRLSGHKIENVWQGDKRNAKYVMQTQNS